MGVISHLPIIAVCVENISSCCVLGKLNSVVIVHQVKL